MTTPPDDRDRPRQEPSLPPGSDSYSRALIGARDVLRAVLRRLRGGGKA